MKFVISETDEILVSQSGLALAGSLLQATALGRRARSICLEGRKQPEVSHADVVVSMIGLLCLGKTDFADVEPFRDDEFFRRALGLKQVPSEATLRQRLDQLGDSCDAILREESAEMVARHASAITCCHESWVPLDIDVSPFDNSGTKKEGVSWTYKKVDGYAPIFAYLGEEGFLVHCELREGKQHCQTGTPEFLRESLDYAGQITTSKLLVRMDAGNDDIENVRICRKHKADYIIKRNLRKESPEDWLEEAQALGECEEPREGKQVYTGHMWRERDGQSYRVVFEVVSRTITADGQRLLLPEIEVSTWWSNLRLPPKTVIELYHVHATSEQFHSEIKSDMDLERLPSGKFATNALLLSLGLVAYNILRLCGQEALIAPRRARLEEHAPLRKKVFRRRLRSVIQDLMYMAARLTRHAHRFGLSLWRNNPWRGVWNRVYQAFCREGDLAPG